MIGLILLSVGVGSIIYLWFIKPYSYWSSRHVATGKVVPLFGDNFDMILGRESFAENMKRLYNKLDKKRYIGCYQFQTPILILRSPQLIQQICVKDFDHFLDRRSFIPDTVENLMSRNLLLLKGQTWKNMRSTLSPSFTSSKMKAMFRLICNNADIFVKHLLNTKEEIVKLEMKDSYTRFAIDIIASSAFGLQVDSIKDKDNEFYMNGIDATNFRTLRKKLVIFFHQICPSISNYFGLSIISQGVESFFTNVVRDTIQMREQTNIKQPDMLGLLIEARKGKTNDMLEEAVNDTNFAAVEEHLDIKNIKNDLSDEDIAAQVFLFFVAEFDTISTAMCFMSYELAINPDVQKKLHEEIDKNKSSDGTPSYETIMNMTYLDMVISESLRKWPPAPGTDRVVVKPYTIAPDSPDEQPLHLEKGEAVLIPIFGIHYDPNYFENPTKFDPERFSPESRKKIIPYTYLPFGVGPRNCIGSRFALMEIKTMFFYLLSHFEIVPTEGTQIPIKISKKSLNFTSENGFHLGLKRRKT